MGIIRIFMKQRVLLKKSLNNIIFLLEIVRN